MDADWSRGDKIAVWSLGVAFIAAIGTWLTVPGLREWVNRAWHGSDPIDLGDLSNALPHTVPLAPGIVQADRRTLETLLTAFAEVDMEWLRTYDFGGSFRWSAVAQIRSYVWHNDRPEHEFLDRELENLRSTLKAAILQFSYLAGLYTTAIFHNAEDEMRKIPDQYENGEYCESRFFRKAREINDAAEVVHDSYTKLIRRARLKLALSDTVETGA